VGEKGYQVKLVINDDRKDCSDSVVGGFGFNNELVVQKPMVEAQSSGEGLFQSLKSGAAFVIKVQWSTLLGESS